jgi:hypothetical protein
MDFHALRFTLRFPGWPLSLAVLAAVPPVHADAVLDYEIVAGQGRPPQAQTAYVKEGRILMKGFTGNADGDMLFDQAKQNITIINHRDRKFMTLDEKSVQQMAQQVSGMMTAMQAQMEKQMAGMSPQQRAQMEQMLGSAGLGKMLEAKAAAPAPKQTLKPGAARTVNGFACQSVQMFRDDKKQGEMCVAKPQALGLSNPDYETVRALQSYGEKLAKQAGELAARFGVQVPNYGGGNVDGVPVEIVDDSNPGGGVRMMVKKVTNQAVDVKLFALPAGYTQAALPTLPGMPPAAPVAR